MGMSFNWRDRSALSMLIVGFALAFDFSVVAISIQFLFTPVFAYMSDKVGLRITVLISLVFNIVGNIIYSFGLFTGTDQASDNSHSSIGTYQMLIVGRLIAGIGSASLGLGIVYFTQTTTIEQRMDAVGFYRISQSIARTLGPFITFGLEGMSFELITDAELIFNFYTLPGWIAVGISIIALAVFFVLFEDPVLPARPKDIHFSWAQSKNLRFHSGVLCALQIVATFAFMSIYSELFGLGVVDYHIASNATQIWLCYLAVGVAAGTAFDMWRRFRSLAHDYTFVRMALVSGSVSCILFIRYNSPTSAGLFYTASSFLGIAIAWYFANMESFYSKKMTQYSNEAGPYLGFFTALLSSFSALGRFLGPLLFSAGIPIDQTDPFTCDPNFSFRQAYSANGEAYIMSALTPHCNLRDVCLLMFPLSFFSEGCSLENVDVWMGLMAAMLLIVVLYFTFVYLPVHALHGNTVIRKQGNELNPMRERLLGEDDNTAYAAP